MSHDGLHLDAAEILDVAIRAESKARAVVIASGEHLAATRQTQGQPTEEELRLHEHLVREWQRTATVVTEILNSPPPLPRALSEEPKI